jgi:ribosome-associated protein
MKASVSNKTRGTKTSTGSKPRKAAPTSAAARSRPRRSTPTSGSSKPGSSVQATGRQHESLAAAEAAIEAALDKKALMPVLLDVSEQATYTDFIGIVSGRSDRQVDSIAESVSLVMKQRGWRLIGREGSGNGRWTLLDFGDVVLHVFYHPVREVYDIEGLWIDAPRVRLDIPPEAQLYQSDALYNVL